MSLSAAREKIALLSLPLETKRSHSTAYRSCDAPFHVLSDVDHLGNIQDLELRNSFRDQVGRPGGEPTNESGLKCCPDRLRSGKLAFHKPEYQERDKCDQD